MLIAIMHVAASLNDEQAGKLTYIQQQTNQEITEIVSQAIELYYEKLKPAENTELKEQPHYSSEKNLLEAFQDLGLVGYLKDGDPNLSSNYKALVHQEIEERHERDQQ